MWYRKAEEYSRYTSEKWSCRKDEKDVDGKIKVHAQLCQVRERIYALTFKYIFIESYLFMCFGVVIQIFMLVLSKNHIAFTFFIWSLV